MFYGVVCQLSWNVFGTFSSHIMFIEVGLTKVNFLDVTLDLEREIFKPYRKPPELPPTQGYEKYPDWYKREIV